MIHMVLLIEPKLSGLMCFTNWWSLHVSDGSTKATPCNQAYFSSSTNLIPVILHETIHIQCMYEQYVCVVSINYI